MLQTKRKDVVNKLRARKETTKDKDQDKHKQNETHKTQKRGQRKGQNKHTQKHKKFDDDEWRLRLRVLRPGSSYPYYKTRHTYTRYR